MQAFDETYLKCSRNADCRLVLRGACSGAIDWRSNKHGKKTGGYNKPRTSYRLPAIWDHLDVSLSSAEIFFGIITMQVIWRGLFHSVAEFEATICTFIVSCKQRANPSVWVKTADHLLGKIRRKEIVNARR